MQTAKYAGVAFESGGSWLIVPAVSLGRAEQLAPTMDAIADKNTEYKERKRQMIDIIWEACRRNYPDITVEQVKEHLTLKTLPAAYLAALGCSAKEETHTAPGEFQPANPSGSISPGDGSAGV